MSGARRRPQAQSNRPLFPDQADERDLRRNPESHRRSPVPRAAADVDPHAAEAIQPRDERLLQAHQKIPRPELPAVRVPGELQLVARVCRRALGRRVRIALVRGIVMVGGVVGHARHRQRRPVVIQDDVLVDEHPRAQALELTDPCVDARVVLVVARDDVGPVPGLEPRERLGVVREVLHVAVDDIAGDRDHVGFQEIDPVDDRFDEIPVDGLPDMDVADLGDGETLQLFRKTGERHFHVHYRRDPARHKETDERDRRRERHDSDGRDADPGLMSFLGQRKGGRDQAHVASCGQDQQVREETHREPRKHHRPRAAIVPNPESLGQEPETHREQGPARELRDRAERQKQPNADIHMQEGEQENDGAWEFHRKKVGARAGTRKTCGTLRSTGSGLRQLGLMDFAWAVVTRI